jgi:xylulokinase
MEGVTYDLNQSLEIIEEKGNKIDEIRAIGGGANSSVWCDIKANIYRKTIKTLSNFEGGVVGGVILAGIGVGVYKDVKDATDRIIKLDKTFSTDTEKMKLYSKQYGFYKELHDNLQSYYINLAKLY